METKLKNQIKIIKLNNKIDYNKKNKIEDLLIIIFQVCPMPNLHVEFQIYLTIFSSREAFLLFLMETKLKNQIKIIKLNNKIDYNKNNKIEDLLIIIFQVCPMPNLHVEFQIYLTIFSNREAFLLFLMETKLKNQIKIIKLNNKIDHNKNNKIEDLLIIIFQVCPMPNLHVEFQIYLTIFSSREAFLLFLMETKLKNQIKIIKLNNKTDYNKNNKIEDLLIIIFQVCPMPNLHVEFQIYLTIFSSREAFLLFLMETKLKNQIKIIKLNNKIDYNKNNKIEDLLIIIFQVCSMPNLHVEF